MKKTEGPHLNINYNLNRDYENKFEKLYILKQIETTCKDTFRTLKN